MQAGNGSIDARHFGCEAGLRALPVPDACLPARHADECAICLEILGPASDVTTTACKHTFHTFCLVETLGNGMCTSCPLCRTEVEKLVPGGLDGQSLKLIAKLRKHRHTHTHTHTHTHHMHMHTLHLQAHRQTL